jgi:hypothetical protein
MTGNVGRSTRALNLRVPLDLPFLIGSVSVFLRFVFTCKHNASVEDIKRKWPTEVQAPASHFLSARRVITPMRLIFN